MHRNLVQSARSMICTTMYALLGVLSTFCVTSHARAQSQNLTVVVLVDSSNTTGYNTNASSPGLYQMLTERYLVHLQMPYQVVDVSTTAAMNLNAYQLIVSGHPGLNLSAAWQSAIVSAVAGGTGFVNLDSALGIAQQTHIQMIFGATTATQGYVQNVLVVPAAMQAGGATPHYIDALQMHWLGDPAGDITFNYNGTGSNATILTTATGAPIAGSVVAELGTDPLIIATTYGSGRAVDFTTIDYMHPTQLGFVQGVDDLFWRSLVWAARKPFVMRGYPHLTAVQMDDNDSGVMTRIPDLWNTSLTGTVAADGTGGPWTPELNLQLYGALSGSADRAPMIAAINAGQMRASPHGINYGTGGDLYWNITVPNTDAQWQANVASTLQWQTGAGGADTFPPFSRAVVGHYWDISNNAGYETYNTFGARYISAAFAPGTYYFNLPRTNAQRLPLEPFRIYEQPPEYSGDEEETYPYFYSDDLSIGSVAGEPAQTFYTFGSQVLYARGRFPRNDNTFPSTANGFTVAQSLNQWEYTMWWFWSGMMPVELYTHDDGNMSLSTTADRQSFLQQLSTWCATNGCIHMFMDQMGDYLRARSHSHLSAASLTGSTLTMNFTGGATDVDGNLIDTKAYIFYGDTEGTLIDVPGFSNGATYTYSNLPLPSLQVLPASLTFATTAGNSPASQSLTINNVSPGPLTWSVASNAAWLTATPASGGQGASVSVSVNSTTLATGSYSGMLTFTAPGASNSPQSVPVTLNVAPNQTTPPITWATPAGISYGTPLSAAQLNASSSVAGSFLYSPAAGTVLKAGSQNLYVTFTPTDTADYTTANDTVQITVNQAAPSIAWTSPAAITYGTALSGTQLNATASTPGTFAYSPSAGAVLAAGTQQISATFTPTDATDYLVAKATLPLTVNQATPTITWPTPASISYGTLLSGTQLNATASVPGTFVYSPAAGTMLSAGSQVLSVSFTPTDGTDYKKVSATVSLTVTAPNVSLSISNTQQVYPAWASYVVTVGPTGGHVATGTVTLWDGTAAIGTAALLANGAGYWTTQTPLMVGSHLIYATYPGDKYNPSGRSATTTVTVTGAIVSMNASCWGGTVYGVTYSCSVSLTSSAGAATGNITYSYDGGTPVSAAIVNGTAMFNILNPQAGNHTVAIGYAAQGNFAGVSTQTKVFTVLPGQTLIVLSASNYAPKSGSSLTLSVLAIAPLSGVPVGTVTFYDGGKSIGTSAVNANSVASIAFTVSKGTHTYTATFAGTPNYASAKSASLILTAN